MRWTRSVGLTAVALSMTAVGIEAWTADRPISPARELARQLDQAFVEVADEVSPAVVVIDVAQRDEDTEETPAARHPWFDLLPEEWRGPFRRDRAESDDKPPGPPEFNGQGSGMIIDPEGRILTNHHVVEDAERIRVRLKDGRSFEAEVRGLDATSDLAVLQLKGAPKDLPVVRFGDSDAVRIGQFAIAIGAPFRLDYTITYGHVSAKGRTSVVPSMLGGGMMEQDFLQTDANINPGNSGGPLVNIDGEVIGVISMIRGLNSGIGFAIPANLAREIGARLVADGKFVRSWLGLSISSLRDEEEVQALVPGLADGVVVIDVRPDGPAREARPALEARDVIIAVDGKTVTNPADFKSQVSRKPPGSVVLLKVQRQAESLQVEVVAAEKPARIPLIGRTRPSPAERESYFLGMTLKVLSSAEAKKAQVAGGIVVTQLEADSVAAARGVLVGDVITEINHRPVTSNRQVSEAIQNANLARGVVLNFTRDGKSDYRILKDAEE
ncbi:MAG TPA: trypsin-like peptidase domain-containing protein [Verrucomicrobiota bacterium]|nr:trypsin-like peptidase domain-containing protein [Verrucomicrobiota bacterium]